MYVSQLEDSAWEQTDSETPIYVNEAKTCLQLFIAHFIWKSLLGLGLVSLVCLSKKLINFLQMSFLKRKYQWHENKKRIEAEMESTGMP